MIIIKIRNIRDKELDYFTTELRKNISYFDKIEIQPRFASSMNVQINISQNITFSQLYDLIEKTSIIINRIPFPIMEVENEDFLPLIIKSKIRKYKTDF